MPRNDASRLYMAAQVQGRTIERQAEGIRHALCQLAVGQGSVQDVLNKADAIRLQLMYSEALAREMAPDE